MTNIDTVKQSYNKFTEFPTISYNVIKYLMNNNEMIWKLLNYNVANAYQESNLTLSQKAGLIFDGLGKETDFRVFQYLGQDDSWTIESCSIRVCPIELVPANYVYGNISLGFEIYCHGKINTLSNYTTRLDTITQQLIETLNGQEVGGIGRLYFDSRASSRCRAQTMGSIPYRGTGLIFCNWTQ